jgi:hypothetical protein
LRDRNWKEVVELVGIAAIVASLVFVGLQLRQEEKVAVAQTVQAFSQANADLRISALEHAELLAKGNRGEDLSDGEWIILQELLQIREGHMVMQGAAYRILGREFDTLPLRFAAFLHRNPAARTAWERNAHNTETQIDPLREPEDMEDSYRDGSGAFRQSVREFLQRLDDSAGATGS